MTEELMQVYNELSRLKKLVDELDYTDKQKAILKSKFSLIISTILELKQLFEIVQ